MPGVALDGTSPSQHCHTLACRKGPWANDVGVCVCVYYCSTYYKAVRVGGGGGGHVRRRCKSES
jgi:hypothetical protein